MKNKAPVQVVETGPSKIEPLFCSAHEAQQISGISHWVWRRKAYRGEIESAKIGRRLLIPIAEIKRVIEENIRPRRDGLPAGMPSKGKRRVSA